MHIYIYTHTLIYIYILHLDEFYVVFSFCIQCEKCELPRPPRRKSNGSSRKTARRNTRPRLKVKVSLLKRCSFIGPVCVQITEFDKWGLWDVYSIFSWMLTLFCCSELLVRLNLNLFKIRSTDMLILFYDHNLQTGTSQKISLCYGTVLLNK